MKTKDEILDKIKEFSNDEIYKSKPALVQINAPLALIQVTLWLMQVAEEMLFWLPGAEGHRPWLSRQKGRPGLHWTQFQRR